MSDEEKPTPEQTQIISTLTHARIKALEAKALRRFSMTGEEKAQYKLLRTLQNDAGLKDTAAILAALGQWEKSND